LTQLAVKQDLLIGLFDPVTKGSGFTNLAFTVQENGTTVVSKDFTSTEVAQAKAYFTDRPLDLGSLSSMSSLDLTIDLQVTTNSTGSGFEAGLLIGDPPPNASSNAAFDRLVSAIASFGGSAPVAGPVATAPKALDEVQLAPTHFNNHQA
jgi:hypothetical protein